MKVLLDHCVPRAIGRMLVGHEVAAASERGWAALKNGRLIAAAGQSGFQVLLTVDANMQRQQNVATLPLAVVVLRVVSNTKDDLRPLMPAVLALLGQRLQNRVYVVPGPGDPA
ncbi:MAG: hypothetical protein K2Q20_02965 [Phycisphaerales bacterium]|nr:hypothetical protein [Phycisphaerales bacterium]